MTGVRCPRCHREAPELTAFCAGCGAPLLLRDEAPGGPVDAPLELDRRSRGEGGRGAPPVDLPGPAAAGLPPPRARAPRPPRRAEVLADVEESHWDLGPIAAAAAKAEPGATPNVVLPPLPLEVAEPGVGGERAGTFTTTATSTSATANQTASEAAGSAGVPSDLLAADDLPDADVDALEVHVARAEPWRRAVAWAVDGIPFLAAGGAAAFILLREAAAARGGPPKALEDVIDLVSAERVIALSITGAVALALATYATLAHALGGATLGKRLAGIRVVGPDGGPPSPARSAIRSLLAVLSAALLGLGFVLALFTRTGRALHDVLARTWVVKAP